MTEPIHPTASAWDIVQLSRHPRRPVFHDFVRMICGEFIELHGDRAFGDDPAVAGGFARFGGRQVMLIGHSKGKGTAEQVARNFGMAKPEGYRKALRLMRLARRFGLPVLTLIDTPGAFPGVEAEERGQAESIARNLTEMAALETPVVTVVVGEGGSGGALGIGVADRILMLSNATYSVISPEGCASILWRDAKFAPDAAEALQLTAPALLRLGVIDEIIPEPGEGAHADPQATADRLAAAVARNLDELREIPTAELLAARFAKYSAMGAHGGG
jgi:acetyl-CoA carboxylase carboxyl transferase subunit alpha